MNQLGRLPLDSGNNFGMTVAGCHHGYPRSEVKERIAIHILNQGAQAASGYQRVTSRIGWRNVPSVQFDHPPGMGSGQWSDYARQFGMLKSFGPGRLFRHTTIVHALKTHVVGRLEECAADAPCKAHDGALEAGPRSHLHFSAMLSTAAQLALIVVLLTGDEFLVRMQNQLLQPPVIHVRYIECVLIRAGHSVDPIELPDLMAGLAQHAQDLAVRQRKLVDAARLFI